MSVSKQCQNGRRCCSYIRVEPSKTKDVSTMKSHVVNLKTNFEEKIGATYVAPTVKISGISSWFDRVLSFLPIVPTNVFFSNKSWIVHYIGPQYLNKFRKSILITCCRYLLHKTVLFWRLGNRKWLFYTIK